MRIRQYARKSIFMGGAAGLMPCGGQAPACTGFGFAAKRKSRFR